MHTNRQRRKIIFILLAFKFGGNNVAGCQLTVQTDYCSLTFEVSVVYFMRAVFLKIVVEKHLFFTTYAFTVLHVGNSNL